MPRIQRKALRAVVKLAVQQGDYEAGRLYLTAYSFLFRVADECMPLQENGKTGYALALTLGIPW